MGAVLLGLCLRAFLRRDRTALVTAGVVAVSSPCSRDLVRVQGGRARKPAGVQSAESRAVAPAREARGVLDRALGRGRVHAPYQPAFRNHLVPVLYSDWWGDYWRSYRVPLALHESPDRLPTTYARPLVQQVWVGIWLRHRPRRARGAAIRAVRRRDVALETLLLSLALLTVSYVGFLWRYPKQDGDNIKALYVLNAVPSSPWPRATRSSASLGQDRSCSPAWPSRRSRSRSSSFAFLVLPHA